MSITDKVWWLQHSNCTYRLSEFSSFTLYISQSGFCQPSATRRTFVFIRAIRLWNLLALTWKVLSSAHIIFSSSVHCWSFLLSMLVSPRIEVCPTGFVWGFSHRVCCRLGVCLILKITDFPFQRSGRAFPYFCFFCLAVLECFFSCLSLLLSSAGSR